MGLPQEVVDVPNGAEDPAAHHHIKGLGLKGNPLVQIPLHHLNPTTLRFFNPILVELDAPDVGGADSFGQLHRQSPIAAAKVEESGLCVLLQDPQEGFYGYPMRLLTQVVKESPNSFRDDGSQRLFPFSTDVLRNSRGSGRIPELFDSLGGGENRGG